MQTTDEWRDALTIAARECVAVVAEMTAAKDTMTPESVKAFYGKYLRTRNKMMAAVLDNAESILALMEENAALREIATRLANSEQLTREIKPNDLAIVSADLIIKSRAVVGGPSQEELDRSFDTLLR